MSSVRGSLVSRVFLGFLFVEATFVLLAWLSVREIQLIAEEIRALRDGQLAASRHVARLSTYQQKRFEDLDRFFDTEDPEVRDVILAISTRYYPEMVNRALSDVQAVSYRRIALDAARGGAAASARVSDFERLNAQLSVISELHRRLDETINVLVERVDGRASLEASRAALMELKSETQAQQLHLETLLNRATDGAVARAASEERRATGRVVVFSAIGLLMGLLVTVLVSRALSPIQRLAAYARAIARGDYEQRIEVPGNHELASLSEELEAMARNRKAREDELDQQAHELERAYRRVEDLKRYHERIVRSLRTALVVTDRDLMVTSANPAAENHWGLSQLQIRGQPLGSLALGAPLMQRLGPLQRLVDLDEPLHAQAVPVGRLLADVTVAPLQSEKGGTLGLVVALEDVTEAVQTKEALLRSERLATIGRMSAHVTHEIRNPLSSIGLNAEMLSDLVTETDPGTDREDAQQLCTSIVREVDRLSAITEEYLRFVRLPQSELRTADLQTLLRSIAAFVRRDCEAAQVQLVQSLPDELPMVRLDPDQIRQALLNLLRNAKEAMPEGGTVVLGACQTSEETVAVFVRDEGIGIEPQDQDRIFDPFYSTKLTGTGLGLALTQQIIADHGARLSVKSAPGQGTEFTIEFTVIQASEITGDSEPAVAVGSTAS